QIAVINLGLRQQNFQLAAHWSKFLIIEQCARAQAGAVEDHLFRQALKLATIAKLFDDDSAAGDVEIAQERVEISLRLDQHRAVLTYELVTKIVIGISMDFRSGI